MSKTFPLLQNKILPFAKPLFPEKKPSEAKRLYSWTFAKLKSFLWAGGSLTQSSRQAIKDSFDTENNKLSETTRQISDLEKKLGQDYGPENVFQSLSDRCFVPLKLIGVVALTDLPPAIFFYLERVDTRTPALRVTCREELLWREGGDAKYRWVKVVSTPCLCMKDQRVWFWILPPAPDRKSVV